VGRCDEATAGQQRRREILGITKDREENDVYFGLIHAYAGEEAEARKHLARIKEMMKTSYVTPSMIVTWVYAALGEKDEAFAWLEKAVQEKEGSVYKLKVEPLIDPRFKDLVRRIGLEN
jgi:lipopolysaccharide biosynthesis regulator YciM